MFSRVFLEENSFTNCSIVGRFFSKRNQVYLVNFTGIDGSEKQMIYKLHSYRSRLAREVEMLFQLKKGPVLVPELKKVVGNGILMEYVSGPTILEYIEWQEKIHFQYKEPHVAPAMQAIDQLVDWLRLFYDTSEKLSGRTTILGNINLRNFIIRRSIYGVDFEDCREGVPEEDAGRLCAYTLTYNPAYTSWKKRFVKNIYNQFISRMQLKSGLVIDNFFCELERINKRRGLRVRGKYVEDIINTF